MAGLMAAVAAGHTVLAPNTELAAALFDAVERTYQDAGREVWPTPRVRDFGGWLREGHVGRQLNGRRFAPRPQRHRRAGVVARGDRLERGGPRHARAWRRGARGAPRPPRDVRTRHSAARRRRVRLGIRGVASLSRVEPSNSMPAAGSSDCISGDELLGLAPPPAEPLAWIESPGMAADGAPLAGAPWPHAGSARPSAPGWHADWAQRLAGGGAGRDRRLGAREFALRGALSRVDLRP